MKLLEKTRKINHLLQKGEVVQFDEIAELLQDLIKANIYIVGVKGEVKGHFLQDKFECDIMREQVLAKMKFPDSYMHFVMSSTETISNISHTEHDCTFVEGTKCTYGDKRTTIVPIYGKGERIGTLIMAKYDRDFNEDDLLLGEYAAAIIGIEILHDQANKVENEVRKKATVQIAFSTLSFSEWEAIVNILSALDGNEGILVASKIADKVGITRSVIVNAMRKFESAGLIETRSLGMKGTWIKVKNEYLLEEIKKK
jgi:transcriptional pleiotropic repressor